MASNLELDTNLKCLMFIIMNSTIFKSAIDCLYQFEWNNIYQKIFEQIIHLIVYKSTPDELIHHVSFVSNFSGYRRLRIGQESY